MGPSFLRSLVESVRADRDDDGTIAYRRLDLPAPEAFELRGRRGLAVDASSLATLVEEAAGDANRYLSRGRLERLAAAARDPDSGERERFVLDTLLANASSAAETGLPLCQDTGTVCVYGLRGSNVFVEGGDDHDAVELGVERAYRSGGFRASQVAPETLFGERNTGTNLPALFEPLSVPGDEYRLLLVVKGGGSSNKTALYQESKAVLSESSFGALLERVVPTLGVSACPPYRVAVAIGGQGPEETALAAKLAAAGFLDALPDTADADGAALRSRDWEERVLTVARASGWGAQFGGSRMALDARVVRLPRHAASCPVVVAVSCAAHRQIRARVDSEGFFLEALERDPFSITGVGPAAPALPADAPRVALAGDLRADAAALARFPAGTLLRLSGKVVFARDAAHARLQALLTSGAAPPEWTVRYPIMYAGPTEPRPGAPVGAFGPTTSKRMDPYLDGFMSKELSLVTIGKGERTAVCAEACARHGGSYLAAVGGAAALAGARFAKSSLVIDWEDLGMEAVRLVELEDYPVLVAVDARGTDFYAR